MLLTGLLLGLALAVALMAPMVFLELKRRTHRVRLAERRARVAERLAEIGAMTGGLAHEIKNPLSTIGLNAQLLSESIGELSVDEYEKGRLLRRIDALRREVERLRDILGDFLRFAGAIRLDRRRIDLNQVVGELADFYMPQAQHKGITLRVEAYGEPLFAFVDEKQIKQAILNLMLNATQAIEAQPENATDGRTRELILRTEPVMRRAGGRKGRAGTAGVSGGRVEEAGVGGGECVVHVIDTGPGIGNEELTRIFTPYYTTRSGGTGLGLPTTRRIIEEHGGRIEVVTEPGRGADFAITLPRSE